MKRILIAGAGHGGLTCAYHLAKAGYDVTVFEKAQRDEIGHDWHDYMDMSAFDMSDIPRPNESLYHKGMKQGFRNPKGNVKLEIPLNDVSIVMDRKVLCAYLIGLAEKEGAEFRFGCEITGVTFDNERITGLRIRENGKSYIEKGDLTVDAAGMYSPVRKNLPAYCGIERVVRPENVFHVYRAYYRNASGAELSPPYVIDLFHMNRPGIDWTICTDEYTDILMGKFGSAGELTQREVDETLESYKKEYPFITNEILRGGEFRDIPLNKMLPLIVANGYAAVGDSAAMTIPLNGSGISLSMKAGKILAFCVINSGGSCDKKDLWKYEYEYFQTLGKDLIMVNKLKNFFTYVTGEHVDYLLEENVLSADLLACGDGQGISVTPKQVLYILSKAGPLVPLVPAMLRTFRSMVHFPSLVKDMPSEYDEEKVNEWLVKYKAM